MATYCVPGPVLGVGKQDEQESALPVGWHRVAWTHGGKQKMLYQVMAAFLGRGRRDFHQELAPQM